jgi:hypothetical protein
MGESMIREALGAFILFAGLAAGLWIIHGAGLSGL